MSLPGPDTFSPAIRGLSRDLPFKAGWKTADHCAVVSCRHWDQVKDLVLRTFDQDAEDFRLENIVELGLDQHVEKVAEISSSATKELAIEQVSILPGPSEAQLLVQGQATPPFPGRRGQTGSPAQPGCFACGITAFSTEMCSGGLTTRLTQGARAHQTHSH